MAAPSLLAQLPLLADPVRGRLLLLLEGHEFTVSELCRIAQLPQSTASRHLRALGDEGWLTAREEGTSRYYRLAGHALAEPMRELWRLVRADVAASAAAAQDAHRARAVLARRREASRRFLSSAAAEWDALRASLFGERAQLIGLLGLLDPAWTVADLGCGTGQLAVTLAPWVARVVAVDENAAMLRAVRARARAHANVEVREGDLEAPPLADGEADAAVLSLVLHHLPEPRAALVQAARILRPGGRLLVLDMLPHDREEYRQRMGHAWLGFAPAEVTAWLEGAGFEGVRVVPLPAEPEVKGPALFAAAGRTRAAGGRGGRDTRDNERAPAGARRA